MKISILIIAGFIFLMAPANTAGITVDVYQGMLHGSNEEVLTTDTADASSYGAFSPDSNATWKFTDSLFISDSFAINCPGQIIVKGTNRNTTPKHTWCWRNKWPNNYGYCFFDTNGHTGNCLPLHNKMTVGLFLRTNQPNQVSNNHDILEFHCMYPGYAVLQEVGISGHKDTVFLRAHGPIDAHQTSAPIAIDTSHWYWVTMHYDGIAGRISLAVYDPANNWAQKDTAVFCTTYVKPVKSYFQMGIATDHGAYPDNDSRTWVAHVMIDYTNAAFPLLPDTGITHAISFGSLQDQMPINPFPRVPNPVRAKELQHTVEYERGLKIYDFTGALVDVRNGFRPGIYLLQQAGRERRTKIIVVR